MKLFGHDTSPYVRRVRVLLAELGLPFDRDPMSWVAPSAEFLLLNPIQRVPALIDRDQVLLDSRLIAAYAYEAPRGAQPPLPAPHLPLQAQLWHPQHRYPDQNALIICDSALDSAINVFLMEQDGVTRAASPYLERQARRVTTCLVWLDQQLAGRDAWHDDAFSFVDIALCCALDWMLFRERQDLTPHKNLLRFLARHADRPALAATHPRHAAPAPPPRAR